MSLRGLSNHLAIATVTAALRNLLQDALPQDTEGAEVTTVSPTQLSNDANKRGVNLYLYQVALNPVRPQGVDVQFRHRRGERAKRSRAALDLHYFISVYGNDALKFLNSVSYVCLNFDLYM